jgi:formate C-acetyltransferase
MRYCYPNIFDFLVAITRNSELSAGFNNNFAAIAHYIANFNRVLKLGTIGLREEVKRYMEQDPKKNPNFYKGCLIALDGLEQFGLRYAKHLEKMAKKEKNPERKKELEQMAKVCERVPKYPAETFHEALQSIMLTQIALCIESYENAISFGRLDQILYPYYKKDLDAGRITYDQAKELLSLFVLKIDECILVNDGNSFLKMSNLFETVSTDQSVTYGGVDANGNDATNDVTYMLIDIGELATVSLDISARVHKNSPDKYVESIAQAYLNGTPIPMLHSDEIYIPALLKHYDCTVEQARNYSIVGCVEPCATDNHFGNTDCANVNLPMPFLQALKGQDYDLWDYGFASHLLRFSMRFIKFLFSKDIIFKKYIDRFCDYLMYLTEYKVGRYKFDVATSMDEILERFQVRLNAVTKSILSQHQLIELQLRTRYQTLLASTLFESCLKKGKDVYEGGCDLNSSGIQALGVTDVADSLYALDEVIFKKKLFTMKELVLALEQNFEGEKNQRILAALKEVPKFGDDCSFEPAIWMNRVMDMFNQALDSVGNVPRNGRYSAGYYALNVCNRYGKNTPALPSGRLAGTPLANSITPHYGMVENDLLSALNSISQINFVDHAENGTTATLHIDTALFHGENGVKNLAAIFKTFMSSGGMQLQPNVIDKATLIDAYHNPDKYPYLLVRIAGYCEYFNALSDEMKRVVINRTMYTI